MTSNEQIDSAQGVLAVLCRLREVSLPAAIAIASAWFLLLCNAPFWGDAFKTRGGLSIDNALFFASLFFFAFLLVNLILTLLTFRPLTKVVLGFFFVATPILTYFMATHGVLIDGAMIRNAIETDTREVSELITPRMIAYILALGAPPLAWLAWIRIERPPLRRELARKLLVIAATFAGVGGIALFYYQDYASFLRNHRELRYRLAPMNLVASVYMYGKETLQTDRELRPLGLDAHQSVEPSASRKKSLVVLVVGETAREAAFSLGGYPRLTNPELSKKDLLFYSDVHACGTSTATALPCMFSNLGVSAFDQSTAASQENLLDVLQRGGVKVLWRENNSGCKGICERVETEILSNSDVPELCRSGECYDEILLHGLQERIDRAEDDLVVVLHQKGSHGPGYHLRYPARFNVFLPTCQTTSLEQCSKEEIANAYDNTILYTDFVLAQTIELLERNAERFDTALLYVSDHGESLGENGMYLHGVPSFVAPDVQTHVPMIVWLSGEYERRLGIDRELLSRNRGREFSHDNLFHSVLGLLDIESSVYNARLDIFRDARRGVEATVSTAPPLEPEAPSDTAWHPRTAPGS
ncbi:MAG: phosphoethanolamine transferase [Thermoanaerobaculia bacterium]